MKTLTTILLLILFYNSVSSQAILVKIKEVTASQPINLNPVANAGIDITINLPINTTTLIGSGVDSDGTISTYSWVQISGPNSSGITTPSAASTGLTGLIQGSYEFELTVTDNRGSIAKDNVRVIVNAIANVSPVSNAGPNQTITLPINSVTLTGTGTDADGTISTYSWVKISGTGSNIINPNSASTVVNNLQVGTYDYQLTVTDNLGATNTDNVIITVNAAPPINQNPIANAGVNNTITLPTSTTTLTGSGSDADGTIVSYAWVKLSGPAGGNITSPGSSSTGVTALQAGIYQYELTVTDNLGATGNDIVQITVNSAANVIPTANAGSNISITLPTNSTTLVGSGTDTDGTIVSYAWVKVVGSPSGGTIASPNAASTLLSSLVQGVYQYQLTVTDNSGAVATDIVQVTVNADPGVITPDGKFTFTLSSGATTSAGVFKNDSILVKTLWSNVYYPAGTHIEEWNGKDDYGNTISSPLANYKIEIVSGNVQFDWQGTIGNTSTNQTGNTKHKGYYNSFRGLAFGPTFGYFSTGYSEGSPSFAKFNISTPNERINILGPTESTAVVEHVATDGTRVYWGAADGNAPNNSFVFGTNVSNDAYVNFSNGVDYRPLYRDIIRVVSYVNQSNAIISGLAVQRTGNYLFVARKDINQLQVVNKTTGALVQTLTYTSPRGLSVDGSDNLWMASGTTTVSKYTVNVNGTLTAATLTLSGLVNPLATQVSTDGTLIVVADGGASQQVKFFNNSTGSSTNTLGTANGYNTDATVNDNKFYFSDINGLGVNQYSKQSFIAYQPDGSFWVNDPGSFRSQHYTSNRVFINRVMFLGANYNTFADKNDITKVFAEYQEFEMDYAVQTLTGTSGWILKKNWGNNIPTSTYDGSPRFQTTLSNGRTYGFINVRALSKYEIIEFPSSGQLRFTGVYTSDLGALLCSDGSLQVSDQTGPTFTYKRYPLTGFDGSGNPQWSSTAEVLAIGTKDDVVIPGNTFDNASNQIFSNNHRVAIFNPHSTTDFGNRTHLGYHFGVMTRGANNILLSQTEKSTHRNYQGGYPGAAWFDVGNKVNDYAGGNVNIVGRYILTSYHGEFWKDGQTNKYNLYYDNGLAIGQFGTTRADVGHNTIAASQMAGNVTTATLVKDGSGNLYLYHGDEGDHSASHRWKISGLNTVSLQSVTIPYPSAYVTPTLTYTNLMAGLPFDAILTNTAGWTRSPSTNDESNPFSNLWRVFTSRQSYDRLKDNDISAEALIPSTGTRSVVRSLGTNNVTSDWKLSLKTVFSANNNSNNAVSQMFFEVLDAAGKVLTTFYANGNTIYGNGVAIGSVPDNINMSDLEITVIGGSVTFTHQGYSPIVTTISDGTGNWRTPTTLRIIFNNTGVAGTAYTQGIIIQNPQLHLDYL